MVPQTFIFIGRSASGKGTQVTRLISFLKEKDAVDAGDIMHIETGDGFRNFMMQDSYSSELSREFAKTGERQPDFLAVWMWSHVLISSLKKNQHIVFDGTPRSHSEAEVLDTALKFYQRKNTHIIYINVSEEWSLERMKNRDRVDDKSELQKTKRQEWFKTSVAPAIEFFKNNPEYQFSEINGEQAIEKVFEDILNYGLNKNS